MKRKIKSLIFTLFFTTNFLPSSEGKTKNETLAMKIKETG